MKRRFLCIISVILLCTSIFGIQSLAADECSLRVVCKYDSVAVSAAKVNIYRVADYEFGKSMVLSGGFADLRDSMDLSSREKMEKSALTLYSYCTANQKSATASAVSDAEGNVDFSALSEGYYLVAIDSVTTEDYTYSFSPFLVCLPEYNTSNGTENNSVCAYPKATRGEVQKYFDLSVVIVWDDAGYEQYRPSFVRVDLICDGELYDSVNLSEENNWSYVWTHLEANHEWMVGEHNSSNMYTVDIEKPENNRFVIEYTVRGPKETEPTETTTAKPEEEKAQELPYTGLIWWPIPLLATLGTACIAIGVAEKRKHEED
ncbi:MAG TPA: hypothetical protein DDY98_01405 [Ruminococcaceae bacterium]|nr:hypothetical protein [Oscillospiraceae bacterium]